MFVACALAIAVAPAALAADALAPSRPADPVMTRPVPVIPESVPVADTHPLRFEIPAPADGDVSAVLVGGPDGSQDVPPCGPCRMGYNECGGKRWSGNLWFGGWLWAQSGTVGVDGREANVDTTLSDTIDLAKNHFDSALTGGGRVNYGRCFLQGWLSFIRLDGEADHLVTGEPVKWSTETTTAEVVAGYRVNEITLGCSPCSPCLAFEPFVGVRYNSIKVSFDGVQTSASSDNSWTDPIVGCNFMFDFRNRWYASVAASIGGFGVSSDLTWGLRADVGYMFTEHFGMFTGLAAIGWDYEDGGFKYDITQWGPYVGLIFTF